MAMSFALAGLRIPGVEIEDPGCVAKTYPNFFADLEKATRPVDAD
jgi:3-phosphoshikimate 1-carboxyvinyltransferase